MALQLQQTQTRDGLYAVTYASFQAPLHIQELEFAANGLHTISPAEKGLLMAGIDDSPFTPYSRTNMDIIYDKRGDGRVVLARDRAISQLFLSDLIAAHGSGREFVVPENLRDNVYDAVDTMLRNGRAFATGHETHTISTDRFRKEGITNFMYSDSSLDIDAGEFGAWLAENQRNTHTVVFDSAEYAARQSGPYINRLCLYGPGIDFGACGGGRDLRGLGGAFGVSITRTAEGGKKNPQKHKG